MPDPTEPQGPPVQSPVKCPVCLQPQGSPHELWCDYAATEDLEAENAALRLALGLNPRP